MRERSQFRLRVAFVTKCLGFGGTELHLLSLVGRSSRELWDSLIVCIGPDVYSEPLRRQGRSDVVVLPQGSVSFPALLRLFLRLRADVIVFINGKFDLLPWWSFLAARLTAVDRVLALEHFQANPPMEEISERGARGTIRRLLGWRTRFMAARWAAGTLAHRTLCVSNSVRDRLVHDYHYPAHRTRTILNGIDLGRFHRSGEARDLVRAELGLPLEAEVVLYIARLVIVKRIDLLLEALVLVRNRRPNARAVIVGEGPLEQELRGRALALGIAGQVTFAGHKEDVRPYLEAADLYASSSAREGFGLGLVEAMAYELPCVATDIGGHDEVLATPGTGMLVPPGDPAALAEAIIGVLEDPAAARAMGARARQAVAERFDIRRMLRELQDAVLGHTR
jgi:glycosyltransferase involved in cell wall biosynthesis